MHFISRDTTHKFLKIFLLLLAFFLNLKPWIDTILKLNLTYTTLSYCDFIKFIVYSWPNVFLFIINGGILG